MAKGWTTMSTELFEAENNLFRSTLTLVPWDFVTSVFPIWRLVNIEGAFTSYHSFLVKGSTLRHTVSNSGPHSQWCTSPAILHHSSTIILTLIHENSFTWPYANASSGHSTDQMRFLKNYYPQIMAQQTPSSTTSLAHHMRLILPPEIRHILTAI